MEELIKHSNEQLAKIDCIKGNKFYIKNNIAFEEIYRFGNIVIASALQNCDKLFECYTFLLCKNDLLYNTQTKKAPTINEIKHFLKLPKQINKELKMSVLKELCGIKCKKKKEESEDEEEIVQDDYDDNLDEEEEEEDEEESVADEEAEDEIVEEEEEED